jgi:hypothetical protein
MAVRSAATTIRKPTDSTKKIFGLWFCAVQLRSNDGQAHRTELQTVERLDNAQSLTLDFSDSERIILCSTQVDLSLDGLRPGSLDCGSIIHIRSGAPRCGLTSD